MYVQAEVRVERGSKGDARDASGRCQRQWARKERKEEGGRRAATDGSMNDQKRSEGGRAIHIATSSKVSGRRLMQREGGQIEVDVQHGYDNTSIPQQ